MNFRTIHDIDIVMEGDCLSDWLICHSFTHRPPDKNVCLKIIFSYFSTKTYVMGTKKKRVNEIEAVLLSTQNTCLN